MFEDLKTELITARNKMLGHADAEAFQISHGDQVTSHKLYSSAIKDIDIDYWSNALTLLCDATLEYYRELG